MEFADPKLAEAFDRYFGLKEEMERLFQRPVDLIETRGRSRTPISDISRTGFWPMQLEIQKLIYDLDQAVVNQASHSNRLDNG